MGVAEDFDAWLRVRGGTRHAALALFHTRADDGDRGVVATADIAEGELLLLLPISGTLFMPTEAEFAKSPDSFPPAVRHLREAHPGLSPFLATTLALMAEAARGADSPFAAYAATLPESCPDCLLYWSAAERKELEGTALEEAVPETAADVYRRHVEAIAGARRDLWPEGEATSMQGFLRAAGLVQSRAFHLEAENWVSGAKEVSQLAGGGTQVFLLPGIDMINHSHSADARNARLERLSAAQAAAAKLLEGAAPEGVDAFFVMRADKPIKAGGEVLHTYGNLSDAQLVQTYGFLDSEDNFRTAAAPAAAPGGSKKRAKAGKGQGGAASGEAAAAGGGGGFRNPYNAALVPWSAVQQVCTGLLRSLEQAPPASLQRTKRDFLAAAGVLQAAAPEATQFVLQAGEALPDELTTAVQVLLMTKEEFQELKREHGGPASPAAAAASPAAGSKGGKKGAKPGKGAKAGKGGAGPAAAAGGGAEDGSGAGAAAAGAGGGSLPKLRLGTTLLEEDEDFAGMVCITTLQVLEACLKRYPTTAEEDTRLLRSAACSGRKRLAVRVRLGEKDVLQAGRKTVVDLMRRLRDGPAAGKSGGDDGGSAGSGGSSGSEDGSDSDESSEEEEEEGAEEPPHAKKRRGLGAAATPADGGSGDGGDGGDGAGSEGDALLMGSDDSDKVGYGPEEYDDGIGEAHDRGKAHAAPKD